MLGELRPIVMVLDLCKVRKSKGDNDGSDEALADPDNLAYVDRNFAVRRLGWDEGSIAST